MKHNWIVGLVFLFICKCYGQSSVNAYKYIIVPEGYSFLNENDKYQLNSLTEFLFTKNGFTTLKQGGAKPEDLIKNGCLALLADVIKDSSLFKTKLSIQLKNCNGEIIYTSAQGISHQKEFKIAYQDALRNAFKDVKKIRYKYTPSQQSETNKTPVLASTPKGKKVPENVAKNNIKSSAPEKSDASKTYIFNGSTYVIDKRSYGYELLKKDQETNTSIGKLYKSSFGDNFLVKAGELSGNGFFDGYGNFILERINPATDKLIKDTFARQ